MEEGNSIIYGLEHQTRALSPQYGESEAIRFLIGTQSLKPQTNQIHIIELEEDTGALHTKVYKHDIGEIWHLRCSPHDAATLMTVHNAYHSDTSSCTMGVTVYKLPALEVIPKNLDDLEEKNSEELEVLRTITPEKPEDEIRCADWHPTEASRVAVVYEGGLSLYDITTGATIMAMTPDARARMKLTNGKWNPHQGHCQFAVLQDTHVKSYDSRTDCSKPAWTIDNAHQQTIRDIDFNPNRQFHVASCGDDAALKIWDYRHSALPLFTRTDHSHWVWTVRYNTYHEQLILTSSSDARGLLTCAASVCADATISIGLEDGVLQSYEQHEDSVYCAEWSSAEPWTFASLSYDARLVLSTVPRHFKYKLLL